MAIQDFVREYFISPITSHSGYNPVNTLAYSLMAIVLLFFLIYPYLEKKKIKFDYRFALAVLPYVLFGSTVRIFEESYSSVHLIARSANPVEMGFYFISPGIYIMVGLLTIASLLVSIKLSRKKKWDKINTFRNIGIVLALPVVLWHLTHLTHYEAFISILLTAAAFSGAVFIVFGKVKSRLFADRMNKLALIAQTLDGAATSIILQFYPVYTEQHFISNAIIQAFGPFAFLVTKIIVAIAVLYFIDRIKRSKEISGNFAGFVKLLIIILGFATGTRDMFSVAMTTAI
ncbi:MAG: DUF63 family protein [Candidatus Micrarchaeota archaeon]|nr:DUF63 family protein [Candidatus Micrarchaeota archaeon]